jgi:predicted metal-dependent phosphotriesterase family hydrolase
VSPVAGVIDMHVHSHPDVFGRNMDDIDVAQLAIASMRKEGISDADIDLMMRKNPARLLGLAN